MTDIKIGTKVTAPVTDKDNENGYVIGLLVAINSRFATIEQSDGTITKVGKSKIEAMVDTKPVKKPRAVKVDPCNCPKCKVSISVFDYYNARGTTAVKDLPYRDMSNRFWCSACGSLWGANLSKGINGSRYQYKPCTAASGRKSCDNDDQVATMLRGKSIEEVYTIAAATLNVERSKLTAMYGHLNVGQQRMCLGNRMRKVVTSLNGQFLSSKDGQI